MKFHPSNLLGGCDRSLFVIEFLFVARGVHSIGFLYTTCDGGVFI